MCYYSFNDYALNTWGDILISLPIDTIDELPFTAIFDRCMLSRMSLCQAQFDIVGSQDNKSIHQCSG